MIIAIKKVSKPYPFILLLLSFMLSLTFQSCKKHSEIGDALYLHTKNKVFKDVSTEDFTAIFKKVLADKKSRITYRQLITNYYAKNNYTPVFTLNHIFNGDLKTAVEYYRRANEHGLDPKLFHEEQLTKLVNRFYKKNGITNLDEAYHAIAELEILSASSLITYSNAMEYGLISPRRIYARYYTATKRPDSTSMTQVFHANNLKTYLDSIQPKAPQYIALQKALADGIEAPGMTKEETKRILLVNLERLRWRNKPSENKYVMVNIPDYMLNVVDSGKSVLSMKVCVGQGRNKDNAKTLIRYDDTDKVDKPFPRETPQLSSLIHSVDVNPVWNIPKSIATKEIIVEAAKDRYYLSNKGINVYKDDKLVDDPESIDWSSVSPANSPYDFKQRPGSDNSLGKIKFLFNNKSSVYLHDTPAKEAFRKSMRAISHGCVRLGNPQGLALNLFGKGTKYDLIAKDMSEDNPEPTTINLSPKVPVYITYITCWPDETGTLQYRPDVYGLDIVLYDNLQKLGN